MTAWLQEMKQTLRRFSKQSAAGIDIGFRSHGILLMSVDPREHGYTAERTVQLLDQLRSRIASLPGVSSVAGTDVAALSMGNRSDGFSVEGRPETLDLISTVDGCTR